MTSHEASRRRVVVVAAVIEQGGRLLVTERARGTHLDGYWEFPGGKCDASETLPACLEREIREELGAEAQVGPKLYETTDAYDDRVVELHFYACSLVSTPMPLLGQVMRWVPRAELVNLRFPPADVELVEMLVHGRLKTTD